MNLWLSALLLAWAFVPPGVQHAHSGGDNSTHRHGNGREMAHHGLHDHGSDDEHHEHATLPDGSLLADNADYVLHLHWRLLGMEFSMAVPEKPADGNDDEDTVPPVVVRVMNRMLPAGPAGPSFGRVLPAIVCMPSADVVRDLEPIPRPPNLVTSIPLCDSARLERSGVLLS